MKKNIALLVPILSKGGAEKVAANLSLSLNNRYNINFFLFREEIDYDYSGNIFTLEFPYKTNPPKKLFSILKSINKIKKLKKRLSIDVAISFLDSGNFLNLFSGNNGIKILSIRNYYSKKEKTVTQKLYNLIIRKFYNKADMIVSISDLAKEDLIKNFNMKRENITTIYNPYEINKIIKLKNVKIELEYESIFKHQVIITTGRLEKQKAHWSLIRSFKILQKTNPDLQLVILGKGKLEKDLKKLVKELNLSDNVHFLGFKKNPYKYINKADIFVLSSFYEGFPNALVEAMVCAKPVISTDCSSGPREILAPKTDIFKKATSIEFEEYGILVPEMEAEKTEKEAQFTESEKMLAAAIIKLLSDKDLKKKYSQKALDRAKNFDIAKISQQWINLIEELTNNTER